MANHVIYDRLWHSKRMRRLSRDAALAYPWIFLVADDHGRFEYDPRRIWSMVFGGRADVELSEVELWLDEYWRVGLLVRYHVGGELAYWYNFKGRKPSERRASELPDPQGIPRFDPQQSVEPRPGGDEGALEGRDGGDKPTPDIEQIKNRTDQEQSRDSAPAARPSVSEQAHQVYAHWKRVMEKNEAAKFTADRRRRVEARLREGYTVEQLCRAVDGCRASAFHQGQNNERVKRDDLELICRGGSKVEWFMANAKRASEQSGSVVVSERTRRAQEAAQRAIERAKANDG